MNLEESNSFVEEMEKTNQKKKKVLFALLACAGIIVFLIFLIFYLTQQEAKKLKMYIDDKEVGISSDLLLEDQGIQYMNIKQLANMLGYSYQKGEYKNYNEDENSCYLQNQYEIVSMTADADVITKYILNDQYIEDDDGAVTKSVENRNLVIEDEKTGESSINIVVNSRNETQETFSIEQPIKYINDELYASFEELPKIFNIQMNLNQTNRIKIYSLNSLISVATETATANNYAEVSNTYENLTAMIDNMLVVGNGVNYGVISLIDGHEIISLKYEDIVYKQNTKEFLVTAEGSVGLVTCEGKTIIKPTEYDDISTLDELNKLYLVKKERKYGVLNEKGKVVVYPEYDLIGIEETEPFENEDIRNYSLIYDKYIPVNSNGKIGLIDIEGSEKLKCVYDSLGYINNDKDASEEKDSKKKNKDEEESDNTVEKELINNNLEYNSVLTISEDVGIKGIVVNLNGLYGIYDANVERLIIPCACSKIYSRVIRGEKKYYLEYNEQEIELEGYLDSYDLKSSKKDSDKNLDNSDTEENNENEVEESSIENELDEE